MARQGFSFGTRLLAALCMLWLIGAPQAAEAKYASIVIEAESGRVLHAVNADSRNYPASLTKIMTLYMLFEAMENGSLRIDSRLSVSARAAGMPPSKLGLGAGTTITAEDVMLGLITKSANDAAVVAAEALGGTEVKFARMMTDKAHELGMSRTTFRNASGLPNTGQLSTARDMAVLGQRIMRDFPQYYDYFATQSFTYRGVTHRNHNRLLGSYRGTDGIKTGYIRASGFNLVASVERDGRRLIGVVFGGQSSRSRDQHMVSLLDKGFSRLDSLLVARSDARVPADDREEVFAQGDAELPEETAPTRPKPSVGSNRPAQTALLATGEGGWAIQVGAFSREANARRAAEEAVSIVGRSLIGVELEIAAFKGERGTLYRSRLTGLSASVARESCRVLKARGRDCLAVAPRG